MMLYRVGLLGALLVVLGSTVSPAHSLDAPGVKQGGDRARAKIHFQAGAAYYRESRYEEAIRSFEEAHSSDPNPNLLFNIAQAHEKLGRTSEALQYYRRYVREKPDASDRRTVETSIRNLEARLAEKGLQQVGIYSSPAGAIATVDGKELGATPVSANLDAGLHRLSVRLSGHKTVERDFVLSPGRALDIDVVLESGSGVVEANPIGELSLLFTDESLIGDLDGAEALPKEATRTVDPVERQGTLGRIRPGTWTAFGVAAAAGVVGGVLQMSRMSLESRAANEPVQLEYQELSRQAQGRATGSRIAFGVGGAALATGGTLLMLDLGLLFSEKNR